LLDVNEILQRPNSDCSQQAIVMMEVLKRKNIPSRKVNFSQHCALEAFVQGGWYFLDANAEPGLKEQERLHQNWNGEADNLKKYYAAGIQPGLTAIFGAGLTADLHKPGEEQNFGITNLQATTGVLSKILWLFPLALMVVYRKRSFKMYAIKRPGKYVRMHPLRPVYNS